MFAELALYALYKGIPIIVNNLNTIEDFRPISDKRRLLSAPGLGLGENFKFNTAPFDDYIKTRTSNYDTLDFFTHPKLKDPARGAALKAAIQNILKAEMPPGDLTYAQKKFQEQAEAFNELAKRIPPLKVEAVIQTMKEVIDQGVADIKQQQAFEKKQLTDYLDAPDTDGELKAAKDSMLKELDAAHKKQLDEFEKATSESLTKVHQAAQADMQRIAFLAKLSEDNKEMKEILRLLAAQNSQRQVKALSATIGGRAADLDENVGYIHLSQLTLIKSKTGKDITRDGEGKYTLEVGAMLNPRGNPVGYLFGNKLEHDYKLMATAVKLQMLSKGKPPSIVVDLDFPNLDTAKLRAQQAYRACIEAGFPPDKIKINVTVNGKEETWTPEKIFGEGSPEISHLKKRAETIKAEEASNTHDFSPPVGTDTRAVKDALQEIINEQKAKAQSTADPSPGPTIQPI